jgi:hypothetical protein
LSPADDLGSIPIKPPLSPTSPTNHHADTRSHSREIMLLENGMIVEHADIRKEEKEAQERRRREDEQIEDGRENSVQSG